jgi:alkyl sulfatase BDS1-like metallo-beta-lactamase superfamily hydrolase
MAEAGHVAWDMESYEWLLNSKDFDSIHPSLQRQAILNMAYGLYEVVPGKIYQVRGYELANISFIKSGKAKLEGNREGFDLLRNSLVWFNVGFEILPGTGGTSLTAPKDPFQQPEPSINVMTD